MLDTHEHMSYYFYGNTTDLYTTVLERMTVLYDKGQLFMKGL
jgi:phage tail protein X